MINAIKAIISIILSFAIYQQYIEIKNLELHNQSVILEVYAKELKLAKLKNLWHVYNQKDYLYPYMVRKYGVLEKEGYKLYIVEVEN